MSNGIERKTSETQEQVPELRAYVKGLFNAKKTIEQSEEDAINSAFKRYTFLSDQDIDKALSKPKSEEDNALKLVENEEKTAWSNFTEQYNLLSNDYTKNDGVTVQAFGDNDNEKIPLYQTMWKSRKKLADGTVTESSPENGVFGNN